MLRARRGVRALPRRARVPLAAGPRPRRARLRPRGASRRTAGGRRRSATSASRFRRSSRRGRARSRPPLGALDASRRRRAGSRVDFEGGVPEGPRGSSSSRETVSRRANFEALWRETFRPGSNSCRASRCGSDLGNRAVSFARRRSPRRRPALAAARCRSPRPRARAVASSSGSTRSSSSGRFAIAGDPELREAESDADGLSGDRRARRGRLRRDRDARRATGGSSRVSPRSRRGRVRGGVASGARGSRRRRRGAAEPREETRRGGSRSASTVDAPVERRSDAALGTLLSRARRGRQGPG